VVEQNGPVVLDERGDLIRLIQPPGRTRDLPQRSPDGQRMAFSGEDGVWLTDIGGRDARRLTTEPCHGAVFSPDSDVLVCCYVTMAGRLDDEGDPVSGLHVHRVFTADPL